MNWSLPQQSCGAPQKAASDGFFNTPESRDPVMAPDHSPGLDSCFPSAAGPPAADRNDTCWGALVAYVPRDSAGAASSLTRR